MRPPAPRRPAGFTLVEVLVALLLLSLLAVMGWRGVDAMARAREISQSSAERSHRLATLIAQWEIDLQAVQETPSVPGLEFDGASLRLTRRAPDGLQLVVWSLREGAWRRWAAPPTTRVGELQEAWMRSQQLTNEAPGQVRLLDEVADWQLHFHRGEGWSNAQSSGDVAEPPAGGAGAAQPQRQQLPGGVRLMLELPEGRLTRDVMLGAS